MNRTIAVMIIAGSFCMATACVRTASENMADTDPTGWHEAVEVAYENTDSLTARNIDILVRFDCTFIYDKLAVALTTTDPKGRSWCDTVYIDYPYSDAETQTFIESESPYRTGATFPLKGTYRFRFRPVMPEQKTGGIVAIGVNIH